jgi:hypothetical protein
MGYEGINDAEQWMADFIEYHPTARTIAIQGSDDTFPALFDWAHFANNKDAGNVEQQKRVPHLTFYSGHASLLTARVTKVEVPHTWDSDGNVTGYDTYTVYRVTDDKTAETFQAEAWLV